MGLYTYNSSVSAKVMIERVLESFKDNTLGELREHEENKNITLKKHTIVLTRNLHTKIKRTVFAYSEYGGETKTIKNVKEFRDREREDNTSSNIGVQYLTLKIVNDEHVTVTARLQFNHKTYGVVVYVRDMAELRVAVKKGMKVIEAIRGRKYYNKPNFDLMEPVLEQLLAKLNGVMQLYKVTIGGRDFNIIACGEDSAMNMLKGTMKVEMLESDVTGMPGIVDDDIDAEHY